VKEFILIAEFKGVEYRFTEAYSPAVKRFLPGAVEKYLQDNPARLKEIADRGERRIKGQVRIMLNRGIGELGERIVFDLWKAAGFWVSSPRFKFEQFGDIESDNYIIEVKSCFGEVIRLNNTQRIRYLRRAKAINKIFLWYGVFFEEISRRDSADKLIIRARVKMIRPLNRLIWGLRRRVKQKELSLRFKGGLRGEKSNLPALYFRAH
jgi:hypothetical protein